MKNCQVRLNGGFKTHLIEISQPKRNRSFVTRIGGTRVSETRSGLSSDSPQALPRFYVKAFSAPFCSFFGTKKCQTPLLGRRHEGGPQLKAPRVRVRRFPKLKQLSLECTLDGSLTVRDILSIKKNNYLSL